MATSIVRGKYVIIRAGSDSGSTTVISDGAVFQRDGVIEDVGPYSAVKAAHDADEELGGLGYLVFPSSSRAHSRRRRRRRRRIGRSAPRRRGATP